jgi:two-component system, OmpR family, response regulator
MLQRNDSGVIAKLGVASAVSSAQGSRPIGGTPRNPHVVLVEDDREIASLLVTFFQANGVRVSVASDGRKLTPILRNESVDLLILDLMLPGEDGLSICRRLRSSPSNLPIIVLTAKGAEIDRIVGLEMGADDYLTKPFNPRELLARIRAVLRRSSITLPGELRPDTTLVFDGWRLNPIVRQLRDRNGVRVTLTSAEFDLLMTFCERPRRVLSREMLLDLTRGRSANPFERSVDILVSRLRQKIEPNPKDPVLIQTIRSAGYIFSAEVRCA